jgi:hypothetical protein
MEDRGMTHTEARAKRMPPGFAVRLATDEGMYLYLPDPAKQTEADTTPYPSEACYFRSHVEARDAASLADMLDGRKWIPVTLPEPTLADIFADALHDVRMEFGDDSPDDGEAVRTARGNVRPRWNGGGR